MSKSTLYTGIAVTVTLLVVGIFFIIGVPFSTSSLDTNALPASGAAAGQGQLMAQDEVVGTGPMAKSGDTVTVNYTGKFENGTVFDTSVGKAPFSFILGAGQVIKGWDMGLSGMQVGGKRILSIPPSLGYGSNDYGPIPGNSTLLFEVEMIKIEPSASIPNLQNPDR